MKTRPKLTEKELYKLLAQYGIEPVKFEDGQWGFKREQFEQIWAVLEAQGRLPKSK